MRNSISELPVRQLGSSPGWYDQIRRTREVFYLLLCTDLAFTILHLGYFFTPYLGDPGYALGEERGYAEVFQYVKEYWIVLLFGWLAILDEERSYLAWALFFGYLLFDDAMWIHERLGVEIADRLGFQPMMGLGPRDFGEILVSATVGAVLLTAIGIAYWRGSEAFRRTSRVLLVLVAALVFFGVGVDMLHSMYGRGWLWAVLEVIEDGGEMIVMSVICAYTLGLLLASRARRPQK